MRFLEIIVGASVLLVASQSTTAAQDQGADETLRRIEDRLVAIEAVLEANREIDEVRVDLQDLRDSFSGVIVAFNRSEEKDVCPTGWRLFRDAGGRLIVGAGQHTNVDSNGQPLSEYPSFADDIEGAVGGLEKVELQIGEIPDHKHFRQANAERQGSAHGETGWITTFDTQGIVNTLSGAEPHDNLPPFVALYFCERQ